MAQTYNGTGNQPIIVDGKLYVQSEPLAEPLLEFQFNVPISIMLPDGITLTFPPNISFFVTPFDLTTSFGTGMQRLVAETQKEEELRWLRATPAELEQWRSKYIPF